MWNVSRYKLEQQRLHDDVSRLKKIIRWTIFKNRLLKYYPIVSFVSGVLVGRFIIK